MGYPQNYSDSEQTKWNYHHKGCGGGGNHVRKVDQNMVLVYQVIAGVVLEMVMVQGNSVAIYFVCVV